MTVPYIGIVPIRRGAVGIGGVCRGTVMTVPYIGIVPIRRGAVGIGGVYRGTVMTVPYMGMYGFALIWRLSVVHTAERHEGRSLRANYIRRADTSDRSGGFCSPSEMQNPPVSNCPPALPGNFIRRAGASEHSRGPYGAI